MKNIEQKLEDNYLLGCIKWNNTYSIYLMPIAWWILNYKKYDPAYNPDEWEFVFRDNIYNVTDKDVVKFIQCIEVDKVDFYELKSVLGNIPSEYICIYFFVDFDVNLLISRFNDVEVEEYLPDERWKGMFGNPTDYLPDEIREIFPK
jgi:hypothetical protein